MSLIQVGQIMKLFHSTTTTRASVAELECDEKGVIKDKFYGKNIERSVLIASVESYALAKSHDIHAPYGVLGENILMDYNPYHLKEGDRLAIGQVILEISQKCTLCKSLAKTNSKLPHILRDDRGIFAKVIKAGTIHTNDTIYLQKQ